MCKPQLFLVVFYTRNMSSKFDASVFQLAGDGSATVSSTSLLVVWMAVAHLNLAQRWNPVTELPDLSGKVVIVTGAK
jgi:hypothetical protein